VAGLTLEWGDEMITTPSFPEPLFFLVRSDDFSFIINVKGNWEVNVASSF
jgi:hypothetical protein